MEMIGYYNFDIGLTIEVYDIVYGIEDYVMFKWSNEDKYRKSKIKYDKNGAAYFIANRYKIRIDEVMRIF